MITTLSEPEQLVIKGLYAAYLLDSKAVMVEDAIWCAFKYAGDPYDDIDELFALLLEMLKDKGLIYHVANGFKLTQAGGMLAGMLRG